MIDPWASDPWRVDPCQRPVSVLGVVLSGGRHAVPEPGLQLEQRWFLGVVELTGLRPSPTRHAMVGFRFQGKLTQGPTVRATDRRHSLRLDVLTMMRTAYMQVIPEGAGSCLADRGC